MGDQEKGDVSVVSNDKVAPDAKKEANTYTTTEDQQSNDDIARSPSKESDDSGKKKLTEADCDGQLGYSFPSWKKWMILTMIFLVQLSMNLNSSVYSSGIAGISEEFGVSEQAARCGAMIFLVTYAFGCEFWAPWSEELGRRPTLQVSLLLVNLFQLPVALAPNFASIMVGRAFGGLCSAGGSVTLGVIADLWDSDHHQYAVAYVVLSSVGGGIVGAIIGPYQSHERR
jgi:sugar phosphate permease